MIRVELVRSALDKNFFQTVEVVAEATGFTENSVRNALVELRLTGEIESAKVKLKTCAPGITVYRVRRIE